MISMTEFCGLKHESQVVAFNVAVTMPELFTLKANDGRLFFGQRSAQRPGVAFVKIGLNPFETLDLFLDLEMVLPNLVEGACRVKRGEAEAEIGNGHFRLKVSLGEDASVRSGFETPGAIRSFRIEDGAWRGSMFFDSRRYVKSSRGEILEEGPIRVVYRYRVEFEGDGFYEATVTVDAGQIFVRIEEEFSAGSGDQLVWDFSGADLPKSLYTLDSSAAYGERALAYHYDARLARLAAWTQQSQHLDYVDGFAVQFAASEDVAGFVTLAGGAWRGAKLNHIEAWVRRWWPGDPSSRRDVPADAKADSYPGPDRVPARGGVWCEEHFQVEAWIGNGRRSFGLVLTTRSVIQPLDLSPAEPLGHFEDVPDRVRYARQQSALRRVHIQHGVMPLQEVLAHDYAWPEEPVPNDGESGFRFPNEVIDWHFKTQAVTPDAAQELLEYIEARVLGFWEGSGIAYSNPVVSRRVAPEMFRYEWLVREGMLIDEDRHLARARFAFLMYLFASENYYTGDATMLSVESPETTEPTLAGMANQNFYTDVINVFGTGAQVFHGHPMAQKWRDRFLQQWRRQLAFHVYPESGLWEESHTYYLHVLSTVVPTLLRLRADGEGDEFANPAMQSLVASALKQLTPRDISMGGRRYLIAFGDHSPAPQPVLFQALARAFGDANPSLAQHLAWAAGEMGAEAVAGSIAPAWVNESVQGLGIMFRARDGAGIESLLALRSGAAWGHHHNDDGSIQLFAKGRPLIVDSAFGHSQSGGGKVEAKGHSRWSLKDASPVNYYWRFNRGWMTDSNLGVRFPFAQTYSPVFMVRGGVLDKEMLGSPVEHWRTVVQLGALTYLVVDTSLSVMSQVVRFHLAGKEVSSSGDEVVLRVPEGVLRIMPVLREGDSRSQIIPSSGHAVDEHATTEVAYEMGTASFAAFLIHVGTTEEKCEINSSADICMIRVGESEMQVAHSHRDQLTMADLKSGEVVSINLSL